MVPEQTVRTGLLSATAFAGMFVFGIVMALLGATMPALATRIEFSAADIGRLFFAMNLAMLVCSLVLGVAMDRFGMKPPLTVGPLLVAGALFALPRAAAVADLVPAVVLLGVGGGALNGSTNTLVADLYGDPRRKAARLNLLGVFFGFGALFLPFGLGASVETLGAEAVLHAAAALCVATALFAGALRFPDPKQKHRLPVAEMPGFLRTPVVLLMAALLFFQSGVEFTLGGYVSIFLIREAGLAVSAASLMLAGYWASLMLARALLSRVLLLVEPGRLLQWCATAACAGALLVLMTEAVIPAVVGILFTGFAHAGIFPTLLGIAGSRFRAHSGTVFGILFTIALSGGMTVPWAAGQVADAAGMRWVFGVVAAAFVGVGILSRAIARTDHA